MIIAIIEDNKLTLDFLKKTCEEYYKNKHVSLSIHCFTNGSLFLESKIQYDIIFLDIELGIDNGINIAHKLRMNDFHSNIIIISGYEKYKHEAYALHCFDYLDKPITSKRIHNVLQELEKYYPIDSKEKYIYIKTLQGIQKIYLSSIIYCEYKGRKTHIYTAHHSYDLYTPLSNIYENLNDKRFSIPHRAFIINLDKIKLINKDTIILENNIEIPLSRKKKTEFLNSFEIYLKQGIIK
jgi:DNA-binding LytR/AlgR family response regulator